MSLFQRITQLVSANLNHLLDEASDPEVAVKQIIRDMEASIVELRRETVRAVARTRQLERHLEIADREIAGLENRARQDLAEGREEEARLALEAKLRRREVSESLGRELAEARAAAAELRGSLERLEDRVQLARQKKAELIRRRQAAASALRGRRAARRTLSGLERTRTPGSSDPGAIAADLYTADLYAADLEGAAFEDTVISAEAAAAAEGEELDRELERQLSALERQRQRSIEAELDRLRAEVETSEAPEDDPSPDHEPETDDQGRSR